MVKVEGRAFSRSAVMCVNGAAGGKRARKSWRRLGMFVTAACLGSWGWASKAQAQYVGHVSAFVADAHTGAVLAQVDPDLQRYPASLTKLMTLYMAFKALRDGQITLDQAVPVSMHAATREPSKLGLVPGSYITVEQAILGLVTKSANDAACALGELIGGNEDRFAQMMTAQAHALGMSRSTFRNASGLPDPEQVTTARDLGTLAAHLISDFPEDYHYFSVAEFYFKGHEIPNHNPMLRYYPGADGMKTGYTAAAGLNLVTSAQRSSVRLVGVVMGASSSVERTRTMAALLDQGFDDEGVAPVERRPVIARPLVLARGTVTSRRRALVMLAAGKSVRGMPLQVAQAPGARVGKHGSSGIVHYVSAHATVLHGAASHGHAAALHKKRRSKT